MSTVNNLNIFTFIKDIYQSLKNIDKTLILSNDDLNKRISKIEDNQQILIDKLANFEHILNRLEELHKPNSGLDKNIEFELLEKMKRLNQNEINNNKIFLKSEELTFDNIIENGYTFNDINESINFGPADDDSSSNLFFLDTNESNESNESLDTLLF